MVWKPRKITDISTLRNQVPPAPYKMGISQCKYREVPEWIREEAIKFSIQDYHRRGHKPPSNPQTIALLNGATLFAIDPFENDEDSKKLYTNTRLFGSLYNTARKHGKVFRSLGFFLNDGNRLLKGWVLWMDEMVDERKGSEKAS